MYVIKIIGLVNGQRTMHDGKYLFAYHPGPSNLPLRECRLITTAVPAVARRFATHVEAWQEYERVDPREPTRPWDGKPNRPLTAYTIVILPLSDAT